MTFRKPTSSMWMEAMNMLDQADRMHRQFFRLSQGRPSGPSWEPPVDIFESNHEVTVLVALPGVEPDQINVLIDDCTLVVVGSRRMPAPPLSEIRRIEIPYGRFERRIDLPAGKFEIQESRLNNGCLVLRLKELA